MKCAICAEEADKTCSGCKNVSYCSLDHQKADWKKHKNLCAPYSVSTRDGVTVLTLRKNVPEGTIILDESPLFHIPESNGISVDSICLVCGVHMIPLIANRCSVCKWPICGLDCESHSMHKENECKILASSKFKYEPRMMIELPNIITLIRAMSMKTISPNIWNDLIALLPGTIPFDDEWKTKNGADYRKFVKHFLPNFSSKEREVAIEDGLTLRQILMRRGFYFNAQNTLDSSELARTGKWRAGFYVYKRACLAPHSCVPNCVWNISNFPDFKIRLRAAFPLVKGQVLSVSHLEHHAEGRKGTVERRIGHYSRFGRICMCKLCVDPTESGTYISAIVCEECRGPNSKNKIEKENLGYLLPDKVDTIETEGNIPWSCNNPACQNVVQLSKLYPKIEKIAADLEANDAKSTNYIPIKAERFSKNFISKYRDTFLHPNHWLLHKAALILIDEGYRDISIGPMNTEKDVQDLLDNCHFMLKILNQLHPGFSTLKTKLMLSLTKAMSAQLDRMLSHEGEVSEQIINHTSELLRIKKEILAYYKDDLPLERGRDKSEMAEMFEEEVNRLVAVQAIADEIQKTPNDLIDQAIETNTIADLIRKASARINHLTTDN